jgi:hypothetical protein
MHLNLVILRPIRRVARSGCGAHSVMEIKRSALCCLSLLSCLSQFAVSLRPDPRLWRPSWWLCSSATGF